FGLFAFGSGLLGGGGGPQPTAEPTSGAIALGLLTPAATQAPTRVATQAVTQAPATQVPTRAATPTPVAVVATVTPAVTATPVPAPLTGTIKIVSSLPRQGGNKQATDDVAEAIKQALAEANNAIGNARLEYDDLDDSTAARGGWDPDRET